MPGARLNRDERQRIAAGLSSGLEFAEIARGLGRPTSTISREVGRNGGRTTYRAGDAQRAARQRARRSVPAQAHPHPRAASDPDGEAVRRFVERFAQMIVLAGMPRMPARVLACLMVTDSGTLTAPQLGERLGISPGAVSKAVRYLEAFALVHRERLPGQRREFYRFTGDWAETFARREALFAPWEMGAREGVHVVGAGTPAGVRLAEMARFMRLARDTIGRIQRQWRGSKPVRRPPAARTGRLGALSSILKPQEQSTAGVSARG